MAPRAEVEIAVAEARKAEAEAARLRKELEGVKKELEGRVPAGVAEAAEERAKAAAAECEQLRRAAMGMVSRSEVDETLEGLRAAALRTIAWTQAEAKRLQGRCDACIAEAFDILERETVHRSVHERRGDELRAVAEERDRLSRAMERMVGKGEVDAALEKAAAAEAEVARLKGVIAQQVSRSDLEAAKGEVEVLRRSLEGMAPRAEVEIAVAEARKAEAEAARLRKELEGVKKELEGRVPAGVAEAAEERAKAAAAECEQLRRAAMGMVSRSEVDETLEGLRAAALRTIAWTQAEAKRLQGRCDACIAEAFDILERETVHRSVHERRGDELRAVAEERDRLSRAMERMVGKGEVDAALEKAAAAEAEVARLKGVIAQQVSRSDLEAAKGEVEVLRRSLEGMAPRAEVEIAVAEARKAEAEAARLRKVLESSVPREVLEAAQAELAEVRAEAESSKRTMVAREDAVRIYEEAVLCVSMAMREVERLRCKYDGQLETLREQMSDFVPSWKVLQLECRLSEEVSGRSRLQQELGGMVSKADYSRCLDDMQRMKAALDGMRPYVARLRAQCDSCIEFVYATVEKEMVPRGELAKREQVVRKLEAEIGKLKAELERTEPRWLVEQARDEVKAVKAELERAVEEASQRRHELAGMVPREVASLVEHEARECVVRAKQDVERLGTKWRATVERLAEQLEELVPVWELRRVEERAKRESEARALAEKKMEGMVPRTELEAALDEAKMLSGVLEGMREEQSRARPRALAAA
eukprot:CAMPEP_0113707124 /NCGR_PEP_ID=MMETSP0038_2-20120614/28171_1 /TAXON_ID=2898 /ORGANISM="Cryptomonas paramecium" /LENGTH=762 /DNA_ID=CAMNT_0000632523 /DNA_START=1 /DNA_END=2285 /DNA_ORIENTATION=+ /assembly_acc=CAM_ASM_000170